MAAQVSEGAMVTAPRADIALMSNLRFGLAPVGERSPNAMHGAAVSGSGGIASFGGGRSVGC